MSENEDVQRPPCLLLLSGGIDSAAAAHWFITHGHKVRAAYFDYGQPSAEAEQRAAAAVADHLGVEFSHFRLSGGREIAAGEMFARNAFLITAAVFCANVSAGLVSYGAHAGTPYYDCSEAFARDVDRLLAGMSDGRLRLLAPFLAWRKAEVFDYFARSGIPLSMTYSCEAASKACGECPSCRDRIALGVQ